MRAIDIDWETDGAEPDLPEEMQIPVGIMRDEIADYLSDETGWLVSGFSLEPDGHILHTDLPLTFLPENVSWGLYRLEKPEDLADVCRVLYENDEDDVVRQTAELQGVAYPCWAVFAVDDIHPDGNKCLGPAQEILDELSEALADAMRGR